MNRLIARLINCGMTRGVALHMYKVFKRRGALKEFEQYVESVEAAAKEAER